LGGEVSEASSRASSHTKQEICPSIHRERGCTKGDERACDQCSISEEMQLQMEGTFNWLGKKWLEFLPN
jgi:hypothetical protein